MRCFDTWLNGLESQKYCNRVEFDKGVYTLASGAKTLQLKTNNAGEVLIWSKSDPQRLRKVIGSGVEKVLPRLVTEFFTGNKSARYTDHNGKGHVFSNVALVPVAFSAERNETEFADGSGRRWVLANATPEAALGFYKSLQQVRSEHILFLSSALAPKSEKTAIMSAAAPVTVLYTVRSLQDTLPKLDDFTLFPGAESLPTLGVAIVSGHTVTAGDRQSIGSANSAVDRFLASGRAPITSGSRRYQNIINHIMSEGGYDDIEDLREDVMAAGSAALLVDGGAFLVNDADVAAFLDGLFGPTGQTGGEVWPKYRDLLAGAIHHYLSTGGDPAQPAPPSADSAVQSSAMPIHPHPGTQPAALPAANQVEPPDHGFPSKTNLGTSVPKTGPGFGDGQVTDKQVPDGEPGAARKPAAVNSGGFPKAPASDGGAPTLPFGARESTDIASAVKSALWDAEMLRVQLFSSGQIRADIGIADPQNCKEIFASFHGPVDVATLLDVGRRAGFTMQDLQAGANFTGLSEANELKGYLASSPLKPMATPVTNRRVDTWELSGAELAAELDKWGLENRNGIFNSMSVLAVDLDGKADWKKPIQSGYTYQKGDGPERIAVQRYMHGELSAEETRAELIKYGMAPGTITRTLKKADNLKGKGGYDHSGNADILNSSAVQGSSGTPAPNDGPAAVPANLHGQSAPSDPKNNIDTPPVPKTGPGFGPSQPTDKQVPDGAPGSARAPAVVNSSAAAETAAMLTEMSLANQGGSFANWVEANGLEFVNPDPFGSRDFSVRDAQGNVYAQGVDGHEFRLVSGFDGAAQNAAVAPPEAPIQSFFGGGFDPLAADSDLGRAVAFLRANPPREASIESVQEALSESGQFGDNDDNLSDLAYLSMSELGMPIASSAGSPPRGSV